MLNNVKSHLFTIDGILITVVHVCVVVGFVTCAIFFQTQVMGVDPFAPRTAAAGKK